MRSGEIAAWRITRITATEIAKAAMADKGMNADDTDQLATVTEMVFLSLGRLRKRGAVAKTGTSRDAKWTFFGVGNAV